MPKDTIEREMRASLASLGVAESNIQTLNFPVRLFHAHRQEILDTLIGIRKRLVPDWVLAPSTTDCHQDHQVVAQEALRAFNACRLWGYELPWNQLQATLNGFVALDEAHVTAKARALGHYTSQVELERPYFMPEFPHALAKIHGLQSRHPYAEAFEVIREFA
ncbi:MAG: PIG-L family deacetylase [Parasphingorhabdus sp.]|nr:PIG-L family deacetylase [Parasphingorhabdus sp.]